jgi:VIT1/CCC1 family predicted Fe2+/Mn2+ transporter
MTLNTVAPGEPVLSSQTNESKNDMVYLVVILAAIAGSLFTVFTFLATMEVGEALAVVLFLAVSGLLVTGYMVGLIILGLVIVPLARHVSGPRDQRSVTQPG